MPKVTKPEKPAPIYQPAHPSPCCGVESRVASVYRVQADGSEQFVGRAMYCGKEAWEGGRKVECYRVHKVSRGRAWPESLEPREFARLWGDSPPGYWLSGGYHIWQDGYTWRSLRHYDYLVPHTDVAALVPAARACVEFRKRHGVLDADKLARMAAPAGVPAKPRQHDFKMRAAGEDQEPPPEEPEELDEEGVPF